MEINKPKYDKTAILVLLQRLVNAYPNCFNEARDKPFKSWIRQDILKLNPEMDEELLQKALKYYVRSFQYQNALANGSQRYDLEGNAVEGVTDQQKKWAIACIKNLAKRSKSKAVTQ